jgi:TonB family protein
VPGGLAGGLDTTVAALTAPKAGGPVRVGGKIEAPSFIKRVNPEYPLAAQTAQVEGAVVLEAAVAETGRVVSVRVVNGNPLLQNTAVSAVKQWAYEPLLLNGRPVSFVLTVTVSFSIPK